MPEQTIRRALRSFKRARRAFVVIDAVLAGVVAYAGLAVVGVPTSIGLRVATGIALTVVIVGWRAWTDQRTAMALEGATPDGDNLVVTAHEVLAGRRLHPAIEEELFAQAASRLDRIEWRSSSIEGIRIALTLMAVAAASILVMQGTTPPLLSALPGEAGAPSPAREQHLRVTIVPPGYTGRPASSLDDPARVDVLEGSAVQLQMLGTVGDVEAVEPGGAPQRFRTVEGRPTLSLNAVASQVLLIRQTGVPGGERMLQIQVQPDSRPIVSIERPGRDLIFATPTGSIPITISARDDLKIASVALKYTRISGSGETFTFEEGDVPLEVTRPESTIAQARGSLLLSQLKLEDGDTLVYRALARDDKPGADPAVSESFLIEIGKRAEALSGGFAVPEERDRQGLSQQMLILKTERLQAERSTLSPETLLERSQLLAAEQRMVRAEFVFMTGGEVVDEVEEAEHSDDLAQGRLENQGQVELLNAMREMSRAETRLNAADTTQALVFERAALAALQKAFDRRRYFLRTLPERARIDPARRLSGDVSNARPRRPESEVPPVDEQVDRLREAMHALADAIDRSAGFDARLAATVVALDPKAAVLQQFATRVATNASRNDTIAAARASERHLSLLLRQRLTTGARNQLERDPIGGALADRIRRGTLQ